MKIVKSSGKYKFYNKIDIIDKLEVKNYILKYDMFGVFLEETSDFVLPEKLYDVESDFRSLVLASSIKSKRNTGILLEGYKGQGKTITAKLLSIESKLPVIVIESSIPISIDFVSFLNEIEQEYVLFIDEFEKIFTSENKFYNGNGDEVLGNSKVYHTQQTFLTFMDGVLSNEFKKLFIFTTNNEIDDSFINRPSRIKWHKSYQFMEIELYNMIIEDKLNNKSFKEDLIRNLPIQECTVDLLTVIIEQVNTLKIPYSKFKKFFNHKSRSIRYNLEFIIDDGKNNKFESIEEIEISSHPITTTNYIKDLNIAKIYDINNEMCLFKSHSFHKSFNERYKDDINKLRVTGFVYKITKINTFKETICF